MKSRSCPFPCNTAEHTPFIQRLNLPLCSFSWLCRGLQCRCHADPFVYQRCAALTDSAIRGINSPCHLHALNVKILNKKVMATPSHFISVHQFVTQCVWLLSGGDKALCQAWYYWMKSRMYGTSRAVCYQLNILPQWVWSTVECKEKKHTQCFLMCGLVGSNSHLRLTRCQHYDFDVIPKHLSFNAEVILSCTHVPLQRRHGESFVLECIIVICKQTDMFKLDQGADLQSSKRHCFWSSCLLKSYWQVLTSATWRATKVAKTIFSLWKPSCLWCSLRPLWKLLVWMHTKSTWQCHSWHLSLPFAWRAK